VTIRDKELAVESWGFPLADALGAARWNRDQRLNGPDVDDDEHAGIKQEYEDTLDRLFTGGRPNAIRGT
jgi:hypothetical protein